MSDIASNLAKDQVPFRYTSYEHVDESPGLYCFWIRGACLYVGQSDNLKRRLRQHCTVEDNPILKEHFRAFSNEVKLSFVYVPAVELLRLESQAISELNPIANRTGKT